MSYIVEEPDEETPINVNTDGTETDAYWKLYSPLQKKRFKKVLFQLKDTWREVYNYIVTLRLSGTLNLDTTNEIMGKITKIFMLTYKSKVDYYNQEKLLLRRNKNYLSKKINKLKQSKNKI